MLQSKAILRTIFLTLFALLIVSIIYYRYSTIEKIVLPEVAKHNEETAEYYLESIWEKRSKVVHQINNYSYEELIKKKDFIKLAKDTLMFFNKASFTRVNFYNAGGIKFLSSNANHIEPLTNASDQRISLTLTLNNYLDRYFLTTHQEHNALQSALYGNTINEIIPTAILTKPDGSKEKRNYIRSLIPLYRDFDRDHRKLEGVVEMYVDVTGKWEQISFTERRVMIAALVIFVIFFAVIAYNTHYAQKIINKQQEANIQLSEAKQRAEHESSEKSDFLANISHELRTPLNAVIGFSEIILNSTSNELSTEQYRDYIKDINSSGKHLLSVINDILDFSKASADKLNVDAVDVDIIKTASSSMRFVKPRADEAGVSLQKHLPPSHIVVTADPKRLKQALLNLLSNSVKFTPNKGTVTMEAVHDKQEGKVYLRVIDTGIGISEQDIPKALSSFGQVDSTHSRKYEGTGLGLPLTKKLVELMGGKFDISSELGKGTTITLTFDVKKIIEKPGPSQNNGETSSKKAESE
jgi:two-component system cell cycle sensor histidine kinase PleC